MIRCTIELLPGGREERARVIGCVEIANVGGSLEVGNYVAVLKKTPPFAGALKAAWRKGNLVDDGSRLIRRVVSVSDEDADDIVAEIQGHHRTRRGAYDLLYRALKACGLDERLPKGRA